MKYKKWNLANPDSHRVEALVAAGLPILAATALCARGVDTIPAAQDFLGAGGLPLHDPFLLRDMDLAVTRIETALNGAESIAIYGDYDVDGISSACLLTRFLRSRGGLVTPYIPDRLEEGYGLNAEAMESLHAQGVSLLITVDCGITAVDEITHANSLGLDVIVTDHHECKDILPPAVAVVDPHRPDCDYPFPQLAGVGVALKLILALTPPHQREAVFDTYADLATLGTVADVMPLLGENRTIVQRGLYTLEHSPSPGIQALIGETGGMGKMVTTSTIGYTLAPRINAAGRMGCAQVAVDLLLTTQPQEATRLAQELCLQNRNRQATEAGIFEDCVTRLGRTSATDRNAIVLADDQWHQGVVGIVASRLAERYACPTFMICLQGGKGKGSCRSFAGFNLFKALEQCSDLLEGFGGHALAAGFTILEEHVDAFRTRMSACVAQSTGGEPLENVLEVAWEMPDATSLTPAEVIGLSALEPFGASNPKPIFSLTSCAITALAEVGGGRHLKLRLSKGGCSLDAIFFSVTAATAKVAVGDRIDVAFLPQINEFRGHRTVQLLLSDLRPSPTRHQQEMALYQRLEAGDSLTPAEAHALLPCRQDFAHLWRYLEQTAHQGRLEDTPRHLARSVAKTHGGRTSLMRTLVCLSVLQEHGLITLEQTTDHLCIHLHTTGQKVDLESSHRLRHLRQLALG